MPIFSTVGLFCYDEFEETPNEELVNMSKLTKSYFNMVAKNKRLFYEFKKKTHMKN